MTTTRQSVSAPPTLNSLRKRQLTFQLAAELAEDFSAAGLATFDDFWQLPHDFIDEVNLRRGGWSAVNRLAVKINGEDQVFYVKRQENQLKRSWSNPLGNLTYLYELVAIQRNLALGLPGVEVVGYGFRKAGSNRQGLLITRELKSKPLSQFHEELADWNDLTPLLQHAGDLLFQMHSKRIAHGALYPNHLYLDPESNAVDLIDFERSRVCLTARSAIRRDLSQFLKRVNWMPDTVLQSLLDFHLRHYPKLTRQLIEKYRSS